ncbi:MAG: radical SAM protein [Peptococcaceae bacterium]|nr:radical SAM protein [Peptococcaceae bacterium]
MGQSIAAKEFIKKEFAQKELTKKDFTKAEIKEMLLSEGSAQQELFTQARLTRENVFGNSLKVRGVIEISNACVKHCDYCAMSSHNPKLERFTLDAETILQTARHIRSTGIPIVFLQSGQTPRCDDLLYKVIPAIRKELDCEILLCVGEKPKSVYEAYRTAGADSYILKFEASNPALYESVTHSALKKRMECTAHIRETGMKLGTGSIIGLPGQTLDDIVDDILCAISMKPDFVSAAPFIANKGTPFEQMPVGDINRTLNAIAIWRIALPSALIPTVSALEYIHPEGQAAGLSAGANVIAVNFTPKANRDKYAIYANDRFIVGLDHAQKTAKKAGMRLLLCASEN